jgi:cyanophycinase
VDRLASAKWRPRNSAATIVFDDRETSHGLQIIEVIEHAESIFIAGGDPSNYVRFWQDSPVQDALHRHIAAEKPIGRFQRGTRGAWGFAFASIIDTIHFLEALQDPYRNKVTVSRDFLRTPLQTGGITDRHFVKRDRVGRHLVFFALQAFCDKRHGNGVGLISRNLRASIHSATPRSDRHESRGAPASSRPAG